MSQEVSAIVAKIDGKTTPFEFKVKLLTDLPRKTFLSASHDTDNFILTITKLWNDETGEYAECQIVGQPPLTPFPLDSKIRKATPEEIQKSLGLETEDEKALELGTIFGMPDLKATPNVEKLGRVFITGKSGSGKSYTVGVMIEELMKKRVPLVIIDRHGEYSTLKILDEANIPEGEPFFTKGEEGPTFRKNIIEFANLAYNPQADLDLKYLAAIELRELIIQGNCIIVNLKGEDIPIQEKYVEQFLARLYKASTTAAIPPHFIFLDEAHLFAGKKSSEIVETVKLIAQEGRKFGCNLVVITQKPQALDTTIRAQAGTWVIHKLTDVNDIRITTSSAEGLNSRDEDEIQNLMPGEAIITGDITPNCPIQVKIRRRYTIHGGVGVNILDYLGEGEKIQRSNLIEHFREKYTEEIVEDASSEILKGVHLTTTELYNRIDALRHKDLVLQEELTHLKSQINGLSEGQTISEKPTVVSEITQEIDDVLKELENDTELDGDKKPPKPEEMYDEKMLEVMGERDDLKAEVNEKTKILDKMTKTTDKLLEKVQTFELEISGIKVENESLKGQLQKERQRADEAVQLAERAVKAMKSKRRPR